MIALKKKSLLYIGHEYHQKTQSTRFLLDMFREVFDVDIVFYDPDSRSFRPENETVFIKDYYDLLVLFQMPIEPEEIKAKFNYGCASFFPMYDGCGEASEYFWLNYKEFNIINFSSTLHERLKKWGFASRYIQFFPKPAAEGIEQGDLKKAFLWQRVEAININTVSPMLENLHVNRVHIHMAVDPGQPKVYPSEVVEKKYAFNYSEWFPSRQQLNECIESAAVYVAPRPYEGIGMSFLEAMAKGRCVIAINHPTMNEYIRHGYTGLLYSDKKYELRGKADIRSIQNNTRAYIEKGYREWEGNKHRILDWIQENPVVDKKRLERIQQYRRFKKSYFLGKVLLCGKTKENQFLFLGKLLLPQSVVNLIKKAKRVLLG